jgi:hypothetical protein
MSNGEYYQYDAAASAERDGSKAPAASPLSAVSDNAKRATADRQVLRQLWQIYSDLVIPLEHKCHFAHFGTAAVTAEELESKPQVLLLGQYSTGKTTMVKWLIGRNSPHFDIRPQPSTDRFMAVVHGDEEHVVKGNAAAVLPQLPYQGLNEFGSTFLSSFQALVQPADILRDITFIDTPGVLAGGKQRLGRSYEFAKVCAWMAQRADLVLLTFDAHKLDISDEFQEVMEVLKPYADKVRCVLNKADQIDASNLVRVYGALLWNVGKVLRTPEVARVYISSFWEQPYRFQDHQQLFDEDKSAVLAELSELPRTSWLRKIDAFAARVRHLRAHLCILCHIHSQRPFWLRVAGKHKRLSRWACANLPRLVEEAARLRGLSPGDLPDIESFRDRLATFDFSKLPSWEPRDAEKLKHVIDVAIPELMQKRGGITSGRTRLRSPSPPRGLCSCGSRKRRRYETP